VSTLIEHRPVRSGSVGKVDSWGFGSRATVWDYPTLGLRRVVTSTTTGGVRYPAVEGTHPEFGPERPDYAPDQRWGQWSPVYRLPSSGRVLRPCLVDGLRCFIESTSKEVVS
jgi:hypothetical protein